MKKKIALLVSFCALLTPGFSQNTETRELPSFSNVEIGSVAKVYLRQDSVQSVKVSTDGLLRKVETSVRNNTLHIDGGSSTELVIGIPHIEKLSIEGQGEIIGQTPVYADQLTLEISGNGKMNLDVHVTNLNADISGLGKITLSGTAENTDVEISGSGKMDALSLKTVNCKADISGLGKCLIDVTDNLTSTISGSGAVEWKTPPKHVTDNVTGIGSTRSYGGGDGKADTTRLMMGKSQVLIIGEKDPSHPKWRSKQKPVWSGFEMGINSYVDANGKFDLPAGYEFLELREDVFFAHEPFASRELFA